MIRQEAKTELLLNAAMVVVLILMGLIVKSLGFWPQFMRKDTSIFILVLLLIQAWLHPALTQYATMTKKRQQIIIISSVTLFPVLALGMIMLFSYFSSTFK
jgi:hypothetical protein